MSLIEVNSLCKNYKIADKEQGLSGMLKHIVAPKYHMKEAVKDINFTVEKGESVAYIGSNGAGKSTTIKMLTGILKPTSGRGMSAAHPYTSIPAERSRVPDIFHLEVPGFW